MIYPYPGRRAEAWTSRFGGLDRAHHPDHDEGLCVHEVHERPAAGRGQRGQTHHHLREG